MSDFKFQPAVRRQMKLLIGLFGKSGGGKTLSGLLMARGIVGPTGKVGLADTENGRGSVFQDVVPGSYEVLDFQPPFSPLRYVEVMNAAEQQGVDCLVIDSTSHEWLGEGGYLDLKEEALARMAGNDYKKREKCAMAAAAQVKPKTHAKFVQKVLRCKMSVIMCFRAHEKVRMDKQNGETKIQVDETPSPMQDGDLIYEMLISGEVYSRDGIGGYFRIHGPHCKHSHPDILKLLPENGQQIGMKHGEALARWRNGEKPAQSSARTTNQPTGVATIPALKKELFNMTMSVHGGDPKQLEQHLWDECLLADTETLGGVPASRLAEIIDKLKARVAA